MLHLTRRAFAAAIFAIPEERAINTLWVRVSLPPEPVAPPVIQRPPPRRGGSGILDEALHQTEAAGE